GAVLRSWFRLTTRQGHGQGGIRCLTADADRHGHAATTEHKPGAVGMQRQLDRLLERDAQDARVGYFSFALAPGLRLTVDDDQVEIRAARESPANRLLPDLRRQRPGLRQFMQVN